MQTSWFDRYLLDLPTGVESWPAVQVQDSTGAWRGADDWPAAGRQHGQLPLSVAGLAPTGATSFNEELGQSVFRTPGP